MAMNSGGSRDEVLEEAAEGGTPAGAAARGGRARGVLRRKLRPVVAAPDTGQAVLARHWRTALGRAARDAIGLVLEAGAVSEAAMSPAEVLDLPPERAFLGMIEAPDGAPGFVALCPSALSAVIEAQTLGRVAGSAPAPRRPTRIDAAMAAGFVDLALRNLAAALEGAPLAGWAAGCRYASFLEDARPLGLLLDETTFRVLDAAVSLGTAGRAGRIILALPADRRAAVAAAAPAPAGWGEALQAAVLGAEAPLQAVLVRLRLPLAAVSGMAAGSIVPLGAASVERVTLEGVDGVVLAEGRLGQNRGLRALRLTGVAAGAPGAGAAPRVSGAGVPTAPQRAAAVSDAPAAVARAG
jgi:flagellar motor switch protein FliM